MGERASNELLTELTSEIVSAYVSNNIVPATELPGLIQNVHSALGSMEGPVEEAPAEKQKPAVSVKKSLQHDYLVCLEDGKQFKSLKRHLKTDHDMTPEEYRAKWGLGPDYPMVAPACAEARSALAKSMGLGQKRKK